MARPNKGLQHMDAVEGEARRKWEVAVILSTMPHEVRSVDEACRLLGIGRTSFASRRLQVLQGAHDARLPRPVGRPPRQVTLTVEDFETLQRRVAELERRCKVLEAEREIAEVRAMRREGRRSKSRGGPRPGRSQASRGALP